MFGSLARPDDASLGEIASHDSGDLLTGRWLIGEIAGRPAAALSLGTGRMIVDPIRGESHLVVQMRMRAGALHAYESAPSLSQRVRAAVRVAAAGSPGAA